MNISSITYSDEVKNIPGVNITSCIVPCTYDDNYPTHDSKYGKGGWREVKTIAERDAIPIERRSLGMSVYVTDTNTQYILKYALNNHCWYPQGTTDVSSIINAAIAEGDITVDLTTCVTQEQFEEFVANCITEEICDNKLDDLQTSIKEWVNEQQFLTEHQSLDALATKQELDDQVTTIGNRIAAVEDNISTIESDITAIQESHENFVNYSTTEFATIKDDIIELQEAIGGGEEQSFATKEELQEVAAKEIADIEDINNNITAITENYLEKDSAASLYPTKVELYDVESSITSSLNDYAKKNEIASTIESMGCITRNYLRGYATEFYVQDYVAAAMSGRIKPGQPVDYSTQISALQQQIQELTQQVQELQERINS